MYAWGPNTGSWRGKRSYKFDSAKAPYLDKLAADASVRGPRSYLRRGEPDMNLVDPRGKTVSSDSENPLVVGIDVTGSMASWPAEIFDRLPLLYQTLSQYREDLEISFGAIGDAYVDQYPLQVNHFGKGVELEDHIKALAPEGGGGGQIHETYELFAHFMLEHADLPNAKSPFLIIFGDERFYERVDPGQVEHYIGDRLQAPLESEKVWKGLLQKFDLYFLHKPYGNGDSTSIDKEVVDSWGRVIGRQRIIELPSAERAVDVAMGLIARRWGEYGDFTANLNARHDDPLLKASVHRSLRSIDADPSVNSVMSGTARSRKTVALDGLVGGED
jgi:hypothetical protein